MIRRGDLALVLGRARDARAYYLWAVERDPRSVEALTRAAWVCGVWLDQRDQAHGFLGRAEELLRVSGAPASDPHYRVIEEVRRAMEE
jgi:hypothetical protein